MEIWSKLFHNQNFRSTFLYTLTSFINQFGNLLVLPLVWKGLSIEDFAIIGLIEAATPFLACVLSLCSEQYLTRFYFTWSVEDRLPLIGKNLTLNFLAILFLGVISITFFLTITLFILPEDKDYFLYGLLHIIFFSTFAFPNALFRITNNTNGFILFTLSVFFIRLILSYVFTISLELGLFGYILSSTLTSAVFFVIIYFYLFRTYTFKIDGAFYRKVLRFSLPFIPTNLMTNLANLTDRLVLSVYGGKFETGLLTLGQKIASIVGSLSQAIKLGYVPYITQYVSREKYSIVDFNKYRMLFVAPISIVAFILMLFGTELLSLVGVDIKEANDYLYLLLLIAYLNSNNLFFSPGLYLAKRSDKMWIPNFVQLLVRVALYYLLVPIFIMKGVILASVFASLVLFIHNFILSEKYFKLKPGAISIGLQFLPFIITLFFALLGIDIVDLALLPKLLIISFYLVLLWFFLLYKYDEHHAQTT